MGARERGPIVALNWSGTTAATEGKGEARNGEAAPVDFRDATPFILDANNSPEIGRARPPLCMT
jgi:hypothetical protein